MSIDIFARNPLYPAWRRRLVVRGGSKDAEGNMGYIGHLTLYTFNGGLLEGLVHLACGMVVDVVGSRDHTTIKEPFAEFTAREFSNWAMPGRKVCMSCVLKLL